MELEEDIYSLQESLEAGEIGLRLYSRPVAVFYLQDSFAEVVIAQRLDIVVPWEADIFPYQAAEIGLEVHICQRLGREQALDSVLSLPLEEEAYQ